MVDLIGCGMQKVKNVQEEVEVFWEKMREITWACDKNVWDEPILHVVIANGKARPSVMVGDCAVFADSEVWALKEDVAAANKWKVTRMLHEKVGVWGLGEEYDTLCKNAMTDANRMRRVCVLAMMKHRRGVDTVEAMKQLVQVHELQTKENARGCCVVLFPEYEKVTGVNTHIPVQMCVSPRCGWWSVSCVSGKTVAFPIPEVGGKRATKRCVTEHKIVELYGPKLLTALKSGKRKVTIV